MIYPFCKFNDCGFTLTELTEIVNNDDDVQGELDSDEPSQYESSDDDQSSDDDDDDNNNDENINGESTSVGVYTDNHSSIAIPYLDHTEESPEELRCMVNEDYFRTPLWNQNNSEHIKSDKYKEDHYNLNNDLIATSLIPYIRKDPNINIKMVRENIKGLHHYTPSYRKAQKGRRKTFKMVYGDFESSFKALPAYMTTLQSFNPGTVVEWEHDSTTMQGEHIFKFLFWSFKASIDGFKNCGPVISIDGTHFYGK
ncbi:hypothetical protein FXO37_22614 [Capsicum annuum]|nr:hypothetical protein FXO37_22614 [Capsicum annuum]